MTEFEICLKLEELVKNSANLVKGVIVSENEADEPAAISNLIGSTIMRLFHF